MRSFLAVALRVGGEVDREDERLVIDRVGDPRLSLAESGGARELRPEEALVGRVDRLALVGAALTVQSKS